MRRFCVGSCGVVIEDLRRTVLEEKKKEKKSHSCTQRQTQLRLTQQSGNKCGPDTRRICAKCVRTWLLQAAVKRHLIGSSIGPATIRKHAKPLCVTVGIRDRGNCYRDNILTSVELHACGSAQEPAVLQSHSYINGCSSIITLPFTNGLSSCPRLLLAVVHYHQTPPSVSPPRHTTLQCTSTRTERIDSTSHTVRVEQA